MRGLDEMTNYEETDVKEVETPTVDLNALMTKILEIYDLLTSINSNKEEVVEEKEDEKEDEKEEEIIEENNESEDDE